MLIGKGVSDGIGIGKVVLIKNDNIEFERYEVENVEKEINRFHDSFKNVQIDIEKMIEEINGTERKIMEAFLIIMKDPILTAKIEEIINDQSVNSEFAVDVGFSEIIEMFENMEDNYLAARASDLLDMKNRIIRKLLNIEVLDLSKIPKDSIIVTKELTTSDSAKIRFDNIQGIISEKGGENSHVSIISRTHQIPAIVQIKDAYSVFENNEYIAMNGQTGEIFINPSFDKIKELEQIREKKLNEKEDLKEYLNLETVTKDGVKVEIVSNIGNSEDIKLVNNNSSEGIGLFRSEFLYMENKEHIPTEEEQFVIYKKVAEEMNGKRAIIRTLDIGGDKEIKVLNFEKEANPFLGFRAIRFCLANKEIFKEQLRAILRASAFGNLAIMLPMISSIEEIIKTKEIIKECKEELQKNNIKYDNNIKVRNNDRNTIVSYNC